MKKAELMDLIGKKIKVTFWDGEVEEGTLCYTDSFSAKHGYLKPGYFYLKNPYTTMKTSFKVSHTKKVEQS